MLASGPSGNERIVNTKGYVVDKFVDTVSMEASQPQPKPELSAREARIAPADRHKEPMTGQAWLDSDLVGMLEDRDDIGDSVEFARKLREQVWQSKTVRHGH